MIKLRSVVLLAIVSIFVMSGCATNYVTSSFSPSVYFTQGFDKKLKLLKSDNVIVNDLPKSVTESNDTLDQFINQRFDLGYIYLGISVWTNYTGATLPDILEHAGKIGATLVYVDNKYMRTESGILPQTTYNPGTTTRSNVYNNTGQYLGNITTYSSGTSSTQYVPYTANVYNSIVLFFGTVQ